MKSKHIAILTALVFLFSIVLGAVPMAQAANGDNVKRLSGELRYDTAAAIALDKYQQASAVIIAQSDVGKSTGYPDALAAGLLAGNKNAPILLVRSNELPDATKEAIEQLGATRAYILGGTTVVSETVENAIQALGVTTERISGNTRVDTAIEIANEVGNSFDAAFVVGWGTEGNQIPFYDALLAGPYAFTENTPTLIVRDWKGADNTAVKEAIENFGISKLYVVDTNNVVNEDLRNELAAIAEVQVVTGTDKVDTSLNFAQKFFPGNSDYQLAQSLADAIASAIVGDPILYVNQDSIPAAVQDYLDQNVKAGSKITILGGPDAIAPAVEEQIKEKYAEAEEAKEAAIEAARAAILALPAIEEIDLDNKADVLEAYSLYEAAIAAGATDAEIGPNLVVLVNAAKSKIEELEGAVSEKEAAIQAAKDAIIALPAINELTVDDEAAVNDAEAKYDAAIDLGATDADIGNTLVNILNAAKEKMAELLEEQDATDAEAAAAVDELITALPAVEELALADKEEVETARAAYDALTEAQKALVEKLDVLEEAEAKIAEIEQAVADAEAAIQNAVAAMDALLDENNAEKDIMVVAELAQQASVLVDEALALDNTAEIQGIELLGSLNAKLDSILKAVNTAKTEIQLAAVLKYFAGFDINLIAEYRQVLGDGTTPKDTIQGVQKVINDENKRADLEGQGEELLALLKGAPNQIALLGLLNEHFPGIIDEELIEEYQAVINDLQAPITKQEIEEALLQVNAIADAVAAVEKAEATEDQTDVNIARDLVDAVLDAQTKNELTVRLDAVQAKIDLAAAEAAAIAAVEKAEATEDQNDLDEAQRLVDVLQDGEIKTDLENRLKAVEDAINLANVKSLIAALPDPVEATDAEQVREAVTAYNALDPGLQEQLTIAEKAKLDDAIDQLNAIATEAVEAAEESLDQNDVDEARDLVNELPGEQTKDALNTRLDIVQDVIDDIADLIEDMEGSGSSGSAPTVTRNLDTSGENGSTITWGTVSGNAATKTDYTTLRLQFPNRNETRTSSLTATLTKGSVTAQVTFDIETRRSGTIIFRTYSWSIEAKQ